MSGPEPLSNRHDALPPVAPSPLTPAPVPAAVHGHARSHGGARGPRLGWLALSTVLAALWAVLAVIVAVGPGGELLARITLLPGVLHALSFPQIWIVASLCAAGWSVAGLGWLLFRTQRRSTPDHGASLRGAENVRRARVLAWSRAAVSLLAVAAWTWIWCVSPYGLPTRTNDPAAVIIAAFNAEGQLSAQDLQSMFATHHADVAVLSEWADSAEWGFAHTKELLAAAGFDPEGFGIASTQGTLNPPNGVMVVWRKDGSCGAVEEPHATPVDTEGAAGVDDWIPASGEVTFGTVVFPGAPDEQGTISSSCPVIYGLHTMAPVGPKPMWRADLSRIADYAAAARATGQPTVLVGDFNATTRHGPMLGIEGFTDALDVIAPWRRGTWNAHYPPAVRTVIDHALISEHFAVTHAEVVNGEFADHAIVIVGLSPKQQPEDT